MNTRTIAIISIVAVVLSSATLVLILIPRTPEAIIGNVGANYGQITSVTFTVGNPNGVISVIYNTTSITGVTINTVYVNNTQKPTWTCYLKGVATSPAVVPSNSGAQFNITTTVIAGNQYDIKLVGSRGNTFEYTGTAPS